MNTNDEDDMSGELVFLQSNKVVGFGNVNLNLEMKLGKI